MMQKYFLPLTKYLNKVKENHNVLILKLKYIQYILIYLMATYLFMAKMFKPTTDLHWFLPHQWAARTCARLNYVPAATVIIFLLFVACTEVQ